ncbi:MAG: ATP-binding protein, partial [Ktedonobacterales bacterium]
FHGSNVENAGAGLGLHVAREAIRRQGGRIGDRAQPGGGSVFWFTLPVEPPARAVRASRRPRSSRRKSAPTAAS